MFGDTPLIMVEDTAALEAMVAAVRDAPVLGIDTESDSFHHYQEKVCLIQLSDLKNDYIIDPLSIDDMSAFGELVANPNQVKILHGADYDIVCLKRDFGFTFVNIFDTMISSMFLGFDHVGLADLINRFFGHYIDKKYQRYDWSKRPLLDEHLAYARGDTHWLPALRELLIIYLKRDGRLAAVDEEFAVLALREWSGPPDNTAKFLRMKGARTLEEDAKKRLRALWGYRDGEAKKLDRPAFKVMPDPFLLEIARKGPTDESALAACARKGSSMIRRHHRGLLAAVHEGNADERPLPKPPPGKSQRRTTNGVGIDRYLGPLKTWRNNRVKSDGVGPIAVMSNSLLKEVARVAPANMDALATVPGVRRWQIAAFGEELLQIVGKVPKGSPGGGGRRRRKRSGKDATKD
jgi:ribonuclease D